MAGSLYYFDGTNVNVADGEEINFIPGLDDLIFEEPGVDGGDLRFIRVDGADGDSDLDDFQIVMASGPDAGKTVVVNASLETLTHSDFSFLMGEFIMVGDNDADDMDGDEDDGGNNINGTNGGDYLMGLGGDDVVSGLGGDDVIDMTVGASGGYGQDSIDGGDGTDLLFFGATMTSGVTVNLGTNTVSGGAEGSGAAIASSTLPGGSSIENVSGTAFGDFLVGNSGANLLEGLGGNDTIGGGGGLDTLSGGDGFDILTFGAAAAAVNVNLGSNVLPSGTVFSSIEAVVGSAYGDTVTGTSGANRLVGAGGNDTLSGGDGADTVIGGDGNDLLNGGAGSDSMIGGAGNDIYVRDAAGDVLSETGGSGTDLVRSSLACTLSSGFENLVLLGTGAINGIGNSAANSIVGNTGNNVLAGGDGVDTLNGGGGNDTLNGGAGGDRLIGGAGNDVLVWQAADVRVDGGAGTGDMLKLADSLNLLVLSNGKLVNVERINMTAGGGDKLTVNKGEVLDLSGQSNVLTVLGDAGDVVDLRGTGWSLASTAGSFETWKNGAAIVKVETELTVL